MLGGDLALRWPAARIQTYDVRRVGLHGYRSYVEVHT